MERECSRYHLDPARVASTLQGEDPLDREAETLVVVLGAVAIFIWLGSGAERQPLTVNVPWMILLIAATLIFLVVCGGLLWKRTRFS